MANLVHYDALDLFENIINNVFRPRVVDTARAAQASNADGWQDAKLIRMDVLDNGPAYLIHAELRGVKKEDISVTVEGNRVMLTAETKRESAQEGEARKLLSHERFYGKLRRNLQLPDEIDDASAQARFTDGILELTLPKKKPQAVSRLQIQ